MTTMCHASRQWSSVNLVVTLNTQICDSKATQCYGYNGQDAPYTHNLLWHAASNSQVSTVRQSLQRKAVLTYEVVKRNVVMKVTEYA